MQTLTINPQQTHGIALTRMGLGAMRSNGEEGIHAIHRALDLGINYLNTGDFYALGDSEYTVGQALKGRNRDKVFVSVKFGTMLDPSGRIYGIDNRPEAIRNYLSYSLKRLGLDYIDLYQPARINPHIPIEDTIGVLADLVKEGYIRSIGLSETDGETLQKAHAIHPISLVEMQYSLINRNIERDVLPTARELGIGVVAFGAMMSGMLSGNPASQRAATMTAHLPPEKKAALEQTLKQSQALQTLADEKGISLAQLAIAWVLAQGDDILVNVGSRTVAQVESSVKALEVTLSADDLQRIETIIPKDIAEATYMLPMNMTPSGILIR